MAWWIRRDTRLFGIVFVLFNVLLAVFNILNYRVASRATVPCVVIVAPTPPPPPPRPQPHHQIIEITGSHAPVVHTTKEIAAITILKTAQENRTSDRVTLLQTPPSLSWTDTPPDDTNSSTTPHTRRLVIDRNATVFPVGVASNVTNATFPWEVEQRDKYTVVRKYIPADGQNPGFDSSVTLSTQGTFEFLQHIPILCERWEGPISVSVYAPGTDLPVAIRKILFLRQCRHPCVRLNVTWHLIYDSLMAPQQLESPHKMAEMEVYEPLNCSAGLSVLDLVSEIRNSRKMPYPINVARNVARQLAGTRYVLASDIELYPSEHIVPRFLRLANTLGFSKRRVFTLPIFEIKKELPAPLTKKELVQRVKAYQAIFFHKWVCDACQNFPRRDEWLRTLPNEDSLGVFEVTKRQVPRTAWEPIYIGTNAEPLYDERLTWEGKRDKMSQMFELCLMDYDFHILDNAFLVHAPGIKTLSSVDQRKRAPYMYKNNAVHNKLLAQMRKKYGPRKGC